MVAVFILDADNFSGKFLAPTHNQKAAR